jgi:predicted dehydrogenase
MAPERMGGGTFADLAVHLVDTAQRLVGPMRARSCDLEIGRDGSTGAGPTLDLQGQATLVSENGALVHVWASAVAPREMLAMHLVCENGEVGLDGGQTTRRMGDGARDLLHDGPIPTPADGFRAVLEAFRDDRPPVTNLTEAVAASTVMGELEAISKD